MTSKAPPTSPFVQSGLALVSHAGCGPKPGDIALMTIVRLGANEREMPQPQQDSNSAQPGVAPVPKVGDRAPTLGRAVNFPRGKPVIVVFLRHCGCPCK